MLILLLLSLPAYTLPPPSGVVVPLPDARRQEAYWSPDGRGLALCRDDGLYLAALDGTVHPVRTDEPCIDLTFDDDGLVFSGGFPPGPFLWRFDGRDLTPLEAPMVSGVVSDGDTLVIGTEHAVWRIRGGEVLARAAVPRVDRLLPTSRGFLAQAPQQVVALDAALGILGEWAPPPGVYLDAAVGVGDFAVVLDSEGKLHSLDALARPIATVEDRGPVSLLPQQNQVLTGEVVRSIPDLEPRGWVERKGPHRPVFGPGLVAWVDPGVHIRPLEALPARRSGMGWPSGLVLSGAHLAATSLREPGISVIHTATGRGVHVLLDCHAIGLDARPEGPFWVACPKELKRIEADGRVARFPLPAGAEARALALDPDGRPLVLSSAGLQVLDPATGTFTVRSEVPVTPSSGFGVSPDGQVVVVQDHMVAYDARGERREISRDGAFSALAFGWAGDLFWRSSFDELVVQRWPSLTAVGRFPIGGVSRVFALSGGDLVAFDGRLVRLRPPGPSDPRATLSEVWSVPTGGHLAAYDPRSDLLWTLESDGALTARAAADGARVATEGSPPPQTSRTIEDLAWTPDGHLIGRDQRGELWIGQPSGTVVGRVTHPAFSTLQATAAGVLASSSEGVFWVESKGLGALAWARPAALPTGELVAAAAGRGLWRGRPEPGSTRSSQPIRVVSLHDGQVLHSLPPLRKVGQATLSADGRWVAVDGVDGPVVLEVGAKSWKSLWYLSLPALLRNRRVPANSPDGQRRPLDDARGLAWQGNRLLVPTREGLWGWPAGDGDEATLVLPGWVDGLTLSPGGGVLLRPWQLVFVDAHLEPRGPPVPVDRDLVLGPVSPDGRWLATRDATSVVIWDLTTQRAHARSTVWSDGFWEVRLTDGSHRHGVANPQ